MSQAYPSLLNSMERKKLSRGQHGRRVTLFPSRKNGQHVACGNATQAMFCIYLEHHLDVLSYVCRPAELISEGLKFKADFLTQQSNGEQIYCKLSAPNNQLSAQTLEQHRLVECMLSDEGYACRWISQDKFLDDRKFQNLKNIYHHGFIGCGNQAKIIEIKIKSAAKKMLSIEELIDSGAAIENICRALFQCPLNVDLSHPLTLKTMVYGGEHDHF